ncbi:MAG TPA: hypothetical protein VMH22_09430 [bacterium]|nr:hypothetical protein [bacterium]
MQSDYATRGFAAVSINLEENMDDVVKVWARQNTNLYLRDDGYEWTIYKHNGSIPTNYVIDTAGVVRYWSEGFDETAVRGVIETYLPAAGQVAAVTAKSIRD